MRVCAGVRLFSAAEAAFRAIPKAAPRRGRIAQAVAAVADDEDDDEDNDEDENEDDDDDSGDEVPAKAANGSSGSGAGAVLRTAAQAPAKQATRRRRRGTVENVDVTDADELKRSAHCGAQQHKELASTASQASPRQTRAQDTDRFHKQRADCMDKLPSYRA